MQKISNSNAVDGYNDNTPHGNTNFNSSIIPTMTLLRHSERESAFCNITSEWTTRRAMMKMTTRWDDALKWWEKFCSESFHFYSYSPSGVEWNIVILSLVGKKEKSEERDDNDNRKKLSCKNYFSSCFFLSYFSLTVHITNAIKIKLIF